jgi:hypothetical protein
MCQKATREQPLHLPMLASSSVIVQAANLTVTVRESQFDNGAVYCFMCVVVTFRKVASPCVIDRCPTSSPHFPSSPPTSNLQLNLARIRQVRGIDMTLIHPLFL